MLKNTFFSILSYFKNIPELPRCTFYFVGLLFATLISTLFYPGFFSNDSFNQWGQVESGQLETWHPIIMTVIWKYMANAFGVGGFFILNQVMYWVGFALFIDVCFRRKLFFYVIALFPPILTMSLDVWKDVAHFTSLLISVGLFIAYLKTHRWGLIALSFLFLLYASLLRINGIIPACVIVFLGGILCLKNKKLLFASLITGIFIISVKISSNLLNVIYEPQVSRPIPTLVLWDIAGISHFSQKPIELPKEIPIVNPQKANNWLSYYRPYNCSLCWEAGIKCETPSTQDDKQLILQWMSEIKNNPTAYIKHRLSLVKFLYGFQPNIYYPYLGYFKNQRASSQFHISNAARSIFDHWNLLYKELEKYFIFHPIFWILIQISILSKIGYAHLKNLKVTLEDQISAILCASGLVNALSLILIAVAADFRYIIWTVLSGYLALILNLFSRNRC